LRPQDIIRRKRDGAELSRDEIEFFVKGVTSGSIADYQSTALLMAIFLKGMTDTEQAALTQAMLHSGEILDFSDMPKPKADKHSTGGVGDKTSLLIAPFAAAAGVCVPMISGRGLGHTGGTLDKLESIPGYRVDLSLKEFRAVLDRAGFAMNGQTAEIAPADKKLYALRDATATVEAIPLIVASIISKKGAAGLDAMVIDVKTGSGAFMREQDRARALARALVTTGNSLGVKSQALITDMNQPLGYAVGNALEVMEVSQTLMNQGPPDLTRLSLELAARMIHLAKLAPTLDDARHLAENKLVDGSGYRKFKQVIQAQGGNPQALDKFELLPNATGMREIASPRGGYVSAIEAEDVGRASTIMGAGRDQKDDSIDHAVGVILEIKVGEKVDAGSVLCRLYYTSDEHVEEAAALVEGAFRISAQKPEERELILEVVG